MKTNVLIGGLLAIIIIIIIGYMVSRTPSTTDQSATISVEEDEEAVQLVQSPATATVTAVASGTPSVSPTPTTTAAIAKTIAITDTGFTPATLTVPVNTTVT